MSGWLTFRPIEGECLATCGAFCYGVLELDLFSDVDPARSMDFFCSV
jgi:hypothetical protein